jgi:hypothetical protein
MPNFAYHRARAEGAFVRKLYRSLLPRIVRQNLDPNGSIALEVFAYSGHENLPEQIASIRSFLRHAGRPKRFAVISDGTYTHEDIDLIERIDPSVTVENVPAPPSNISPSLASYLQAHPTGKQLALVMSLPRDEPALYVDSDVFFFAQANDLAKAQGRPALYLADCQFSGDARLIRSPDERKAPVNTGALLISQELDWSLGIERLVELSGAPNFFTNQTVTHLVMHANGAAPFDPGKYVLQLDDQTVYRDWHAGDRLALRHYVNPVRHKFWTTLWRQ